MESVKKHRSRTAPKGNGGQGRKRKNSEGIEDIHDEKKLRL